MPLQKQSRLSKCAACGNRSYYWCPVTAKCADCYGKRGYDGSRRYKNSYSHSQSSSNSKYKHSSAYKPSAMSSMNYNHHNQYNHHNHYNHHKHHNKHSPSSNNHHYNEQKYNHHNHGNNSYKYSNNNGNTNSNNQSKSSKYSMERLAPSTIDMAQATGVWSPNQIAYLKATKDSKDKEDVQAHRTVQYMLLKGLGLKWSDFPFGKENNALVHGKYKMSQKQRHYLDNVKNMPGLGKVLFPNDAEMANGFGDWVNLVGVDELENMGLFDGPLVEFDPNDD